MEKVESKHKQMGNCSKERETTRKKQIQLLRETRTKNKNNRVAEMETASNEVISRLNTAREKISELEDRPPY